MGVASSKILRGTTGNVIFLLSPSHTFKHRRGAIHVSSLLLAISTYGLCVLKHQHKLSTNWPQRRNLQLGNPATAGDLLIFTSKAAGIQHWAVYIGNGEVVHYNKRDTEADGLKGRVIREKLSEYLERKGDVKLTVEKPKEGTPWQWLLGMDLELNIPLGDGDLVAQRALSQVGEDDYNIVYNNCEHFAKWCKYGARSSKQARRLNSFIQFGRIIGSAALCILLLRLTMSDVHAVFGGSLVLYAHYIYAVGVVQSNYRRISQEFLLASTECEKYSNPGASEYFYRHSETMAVADAIYNALIDLIEQFVF